MSAVREEGVLHGREYQDTRHHFGRSRAFYRGADRRGQRGRRRDRLLRLGRPGKVAEIDGGCAHLARRGGFICRVDPLRVSYGHLRRVDDRLRQTQPGDGLGNVGPARPDTDGRRIYLDVDLSRES